jgi:hypothetical protein
MHDPNDQFDQHLRRHLCDLDSDRRDETAARTAVHGAQGERSARRDVAEQRRPSPRNRAVRHTLHPVSRVAAAAIRAPAARGDTGTGLWRKFLMELFAPYRPELHYMRGPGPKWREKHGRAAAH